MRVSHFPQFLTSYLCLICEAQFCLPAVFEAQETKQFEQIEVAIIGSCTLWIKYFFICFIVNSSKNNPLQVVLRKNSYVAN